MTGYVENLLSSEMLLMLRDEIEKFQIDQSFSPLIFYCLKSSRLTPEGKNCFLGLVVERLENEIELLNFQIESYNFQDPKQFLETLPPSKQETIGLPLDICIDSLQLEVCVEELGQQT